MRRVTWSWDDTHEHETIFSVDELVCYVSCPCDIKRFVTINWNCYLALSFVMHDEIIFMQTKKLSWNFSFQAVKRRRKIRLTCDEAMNAAVLQELNYI